jgi:hypothetical protein
LADDKDLRERVRRLESKEMASSRAA